MISLFGSVQEVTLPKASDVQQGGQIKVLVVNKWAIELVSVGIYRRDIILGPSALVLDCWCSSIRRIKCEGKSSEAL